MNRRAHFLVAALLISPLVANRPAAADPIALAASSQSLVATGGDVWIYFGGSDAGFDSWLFLDSPSSAGPFFPNHSTTVGESVSLGFFDAGSPLVFGLHVVNTGESFFTGPATANPDGVVHAQASLWAGSPEIPAGVRIAFEDLFGGGDSDFNDYAVVATNVRIEETPPVPEPATLLLFGTGALAIGRRAWGRCKQQG